MSAASDKRGGSGAGGTTERPGLSVAGISYQLALLGRWKHCLHDAEAAWPTLAGGELTQVAGNFHKLAGLLQLRLRLSREEADRQAKTFFDAHMA